MRRGGRGALATDRSDGQSTTDHGDKAVTVPLWATRVTAGILVEGRRRLTTPRRAEAARLSCILWGCADAGRCGRRAHPVPTQHGVRFQLAHQRDNLFAWAS